MLVHIEGTHSVNCPSVGVGQKVDGFVTIQASIFGGGGGNAESLSGRTWAQEPMNAA